MAAALRTPISDKNLVLLSEDQIQGSAIASMPLQHLDLIAVGILNEEELREQLAVAHELLDVPAAHSRADLKRACSASRSSTANATCDHKRRHARKARSAPRFQVSSTSKSHLVVSEIDQGEAVEIEAIGDVQPKRVLVEVDRFIQVQNADHHMNGFRHQHTPEKLPHRRILFVVITLSYDPKAVQRVAPSRSFCKCGGHIGN